MVFWNLVEYNSFENQERMMFMKTTFKYSYYDNEVYIISNEEIANLKQVEITQSFLSEYEYAVTRYIEYEENENIGQALYTEVMDHPDVKETILEAKENGFPDAMVFIQSASLPFTKIDIFIHKLQKLKFVSEVIQIIKARGIS